MPTLASASRTTPTTVVALRTQPPEEPARPTARSPATSRWACPRCPTARRRPGHDGSRRPPAAGGSGVGRPVSWLMPPPRRSAGTRTISAYVGLLASSSSCRPRPDHLAVLQDDDLVRVDDRGDALGHDDDRGVAGDRGQCGAQPAVRGQVERRERVVEEVDLRLPDQRPGDGQPLPLAAGDVGAALDDGGLQAVRAWPRRRRGPARCRAPPTARRRWPPGCRTAGSSRRCRRRGSGRWGTSPTRRQSTSGARSRTSTPSTSTCPPVASNRRGTRLTNVVFPAPVLPMTAVVRPRSASSEMPCSTGDSAPG